MNLSQKITRWRSYSPTELVGNASEHLPFWLSALLTISIAYYLARLFWLLMPVGGGIEWTVSMAPASTSEPSTVAVNYDSIADAHLFGENSANANPVPVETVNAPDTRLNLKLKGTVATDDQSKAHAIILDGTGNEDGFFIHDLIPGGAVLYRVLPDRVILNRGGILETLRLPKKSTGAAAGASRTRPATSRVAPTPPTRVQNLAAPTATSFTDVVRPQPYMPNGQLKGYRVYPGRDRRAFASLGLQAGDLVTEINGMALNIPAQGMEAFGTLSNAAPVTLTVERNGEPISMTVDVTQLTD
ncbi:MAG: type II secretion system protein GspC [Pseudomonadota bacterium]|nr:type II secretion system protein GspC [Pseudomonadota bacterium]